ncbi:Peptidoglycan-binding domain 1 protein [Streptomyces venezuelae]|uniref:peptidoglycan-binding domain-containing protein n=1 Tax=Streptomyces gardneri TaxID=66892 RepID=UPI0006BD2249|nr:peptidoglycan-binding protein [Streptomyces gardneri]ALO05965.1 Peptidoglycan-binding domain 1 protein [Streptomyces venezuelae]QPK43475.1 peptidoglycan-binding protein [Streptomyces gardneri]WRK34710.1 peptidoglycan-binding protein [Streptomyces venezuelae]CUM43812.1 hypothetical protein BN2537_16589 [Streptomyces venezuelae]
MALQLESARFRGDPVLERIRAADTSAYLKYGQSGAPVKAVQCGLIDLGYAIPSGATGFFGNETSQAVKSFKQDEGLTPADPVVGVGTITRLDGKWAIPNADRDEWLSWSTRPISEFDFTRKNEMDRLSYGEKFTFNPVCGAIPTEFRDAITQALYELLDPRGSPDGRYSPSASWGASPLDLYHFHVAIDIGPTGPAPSWVAPGSIKDKAGKYYDRAMQLRAKADLVAPQWTTAWTTAYRKLLLTPDPGTTVTMVDRFVEVLDKALSQSSTEGQALRLIWHSFESTPWRPVDVDKLNLRRHWRNTLFLTPSEPLAHPPFVPTPSNHALHYYEFMEPAFLVDQNRVITLFGPTMVETAALVGLAMHRVWDVWPPDPAEPDPFAHPARKETGGEHASVRPEEPHRRTDGAARGAA